MKKEEIEKRKQAIVQLVKDQFAFHKEASPIFHIVSRSGEEFLVGVMGEFNEDIKAGVAEKIRELAREKDAVLVAFRCEAWTSVLDNMEKSECDQLFSHGFRPKNDPERIDTLILAFQSIYGSEVFMWRIDRQKDSVELKDEKVMDGPPKGMEGTFHNLIGLEDTEDH